MFEEFEGVGSFASCAYTLLLRSFSLNISSNRLNTNKYYQPEMETSEMMDTPISQPHTRLDFAYGLGCCMVWVGIFGFSGGAIPNSEVCAILSFDWQQSHSF